MKSAWRELLVKTAVGCFAIGSMTALSGCQTWSPSTWGIPAGTRVPPPATGTVQPQGAYYNNGPMGASAAPIKSTTQYRPGSTAGSSAPVVQASTVNRIDSNGSMPATNLSANAAFGNSATSIGFQGSNGQVSTAGYTDNGSGMAQVVTAGSLQGNSNFTSDNAMGAASNVGENVNLQWTGK